MQTEWLLEISLKSICSSPFLVNTPLSSSLAHKALHNGSPAYLLFLSCHFPSSVLHPVCLSPRGLFSCLRASVDIPFLVLGIFFPYPIFYYFYKRSNTRIKYFNSLVRNNCYPLAALTSMAACTCPLYFSLVRFWSFLFMDMGPLPKLPWAEATSLSFCFLAFLEQGLL